MNLNEKNFALAGGVFWSIVMFILTWVSIWTGYGSMWLALMSDIYPGYYVTWWGSFVGLVYGFFDAYIGLYILAWLYNRFNS